MQLDEDKIEEVKAKLDLDTKLDIPGMIKVLHVIKDLELEEPIDDQDEYLDAFVALGGQGDK